MQVSITITGSAQEVAKFKEAGNALANFSKELREIGQFLVGWYASYPFTSEGQIYGNRWTPLTPGYAKRKANLYRGKGLLVASGAMQQAFKADNSTNTLRVFNTTDYFKYHQLGTNKMPQRPVISVGSYNIEGIKQILQAGIKAKLAALL